MRDFYEPTRWMYLITDRQLLSSMGHRLPLLLTTDVALSALLCYPPVAASPDIPHCTSFTLVGSVIYSFADASSPKLVNLCPSKVILALSVIDDLGVFLGWLSIGSPRRRAIG